MHARSPPTTTGSQVGDVIVVLIRVVTALNGLLCGSSDPGVLYRTLTLSHAIEYEYR